MLKSMTGYGRARDRIDGYDITVEIKSVNNKTLDLSVRLPKAYTFAEERIKPLLLSCGVCRGKIDVYISVDIPQTELAVLSLDRDYASQYIAALRQLRDEFGLQDDISVMKVAENRDIFSVTKPEDDLEADWERIRTVLLAAVMKFDEARRAEGERLTKDVEAKLEKISGIVDEIESHASDAVTEYEARLKKKLTEALAEICAQADESRIITECAIFADRVATDEETVRLRSHIKAFRETLQGDGPGGRNLDFWCQEMNREANTTGSKAQDQYITSLVVSVKCELEKIREQIQNLE
ncbi:MAG: YicC family protein [Clostridia bacterium]|nr:YicC family protein [Clostridia bacterium]